MVQLIPKCVKLASFAKPIGMLINADPEDDK